ncbi:MAG TPA: AMIN domain-containing protein, partial [Terriglobales bacterium]|nr:AMIN domain-containing protein [Terriglobales bacterium]
MAFFLACCLLGPSAAAVDAAATESKPEDPRILFETAGQLFVALQSKPPAMRMRADYSRVIEAYRSVYHAAPASLRADPSAYAVAELTEEMGHRFNDAAVLQQAVKQYRFLLRAYPATRHHAESLLAIGNIEAEALNDREAAREAYRDLIAHYGDTAEATQARGKLASLDAPAPPKAPVAAAVTTAPAATPPPRVATVEAPATAAPKPDAQSSAPQPGASATIRSVRHWSTAEYTRIAIDVDREVHYEVGEVPGPERIFFDLSDTRPATGPLTKSYEINDGLVQRVRVAPYRPGTARVVVELAAPADYTPFVLP